MSTASVVLLFVAIDNSGSATSIVVEDTVVCVPLTVRLPAIVTSLGRPIVTVVPDAEVSISFEVPAIVNVSESRSTSIVPLSDVTSKSCAVTCESTYALTDCCVGRDVSLSDAILSSSIVVIPSNKSALRFVTLVVDATVNGAVPVATSDSKVCALIS